MLFYITFPLSHIFANNFIEAKAIDRIVVQKWTLRHFPEWASIYTEDQFKKIKKMFKDGKIGLTAEVE